VGNLWQINLGNLVVRRKTHIRNIHDKPLTRYYRLLLILMNFLEPINYF
jgi:hypothetical protein